MNTIKIKVYGGINAAGGGCGCGCSGCTPADARAEFEAVQADLLKKYGEEALDFEFIDTGDDLHKYPKVQEIIQAGYSFPVIVVDGNPRLAGGMPMESMLKIINEIQAAQ
ncbi:hypothetical protein ASZ90_019282 [hydrocarbon metagenome]|uniref:Thioredoxin-like fold domain-containing protein n=1 Tax=hydrocarbon metagenome TaxID=938273 RepID=A0A0W8E3S1_9ZZZZ